MGRCAHGTECSEHSDEKNFKNTFSNFFLEIEPIFFSNFIFSKFLIFQLKYAELSQKLKYNRLIAGDHESLKMKKICRGVIMADQYIVSVHLSEKVKKKKLEKNENRRYSWSRCDEGI